MPTISIAQADGSGLAHAGSSDGRPPSRRSGRRSTELLFRRAQRWSGLVASTPLDLAAGPSGRSSTLDEAYDLAGPRGRPTAIRSPTNAGRLPPEDQTPGSPALGPMSIAADGTGTTCARRSRAAPIRRRAQPGLHDRTASWSSVVTRWDEDVLTDRHSARRPVTGVLDVPYDGVRRRPLAAASSSDARDGFG